MPLDAPIVTDRQRCGIEEGNARWRRQWRLEIKAQGQERARHQLHKPIVAGQVWKLGAPIRANMVGVIRFEVTVWETPCFDG